MFLLPLSAVLLPLYHTSALLSIFGKERPWRGKRPWRERDASWKRRPSPSKPPSPSQNFPTRPPSLLGRCLVSLFVVMGVLWESFWFGGRCKFFTWHGFALVLRVGYDSQVCLTHPSHQSGAKPHAATNSYLPKHKKTSPMPPPLSKSETNLRFESGGGMGEVLGERGRFGGREPRLSRGGSLPPRSFFLPLSS